MPQGYRPLAACTVFYSFYAAALRQQLQFIHAQHVTLL